MAAPIINIPNNLTQYLATFGTNAKLNSTLPAAPGGKANVTWQFDQFGNISAYVTGGGGVNFGPADYGVTNAGEFTFPDPVVINAVAAVGPTTITDTGGNGGFFVTTDSNDGGIGLQATGFSGITLNGQAGVTLDAGGSSNITLSTNTGVVEVEAPIVVNPATSQIGLTVEAANGQTANLVAFENHTGGFVSGINKTADFVFSSTTGQPVDAPVTNSARFDNATSKLWVYNGTAWVGTVLS